MSATLLDLPNKTPETFVPCANCPALQRLERELAELRREVSELRCDVGYWKSRHADAVQRIEQLKRIFPLGYSANRYRSRTSVDFAVLLYTRIVANNVSYSSLTMVS